MQVLFNRSFLSILSDALNFARHWIRSKNPTIQNIDSRRLTGLIALDTSQFHFFLFSPPSSLSHEYNERDVLHNLAPYILYLRSKSSKGKKKRNIVVPEQQRSIDPRFKKKKLKLQTANEVYHVQFKFHRPRFPVFVHRTCRRNSPADIFIPLSPHGKSLMTLVIREWKQ